VDPSAVEELIMTSLVLFLILAATPAETEAPVEVRLPEPRSTGEVTVESALRHRRSRRSYADEPLTLAEASQLLWAAQGVTDRADGGRTAPSAGALYPLEVYLAAGEVTGLEAGIYRYRPASHTLTRVAAGDRRDAIAGAAGRQGWVRRAPAVIVIAAVPRRTAVKYGSRAERYVHMEVGAAAENVYLQAEALGLATVFVGAFDDRALHAAAHLGDGEEPLAVLPVGKRADRR
jgi:SagB-type dehydrogenase family enzyme